MYVLGGNAHVAHRRVSMSVCAMTIGITALA